MPSFVRVQSSFAAKQSTERWRNSDRYAKTTRTYAIKRWIQAKLPETKVERKIKGLVKEQKRLSVDNPQFKELQTALERQRTKLAKLGSKRRRRNRSAVKINSVAGPTTESVAQRAKTVSGPEAGGRTVPLQPQRSRAVRELVGARGAGCRLGAPGSNCRAEASKSSSVPAD